MRPSRLFVHSSGGTIHLVDAPWLAQWADFLQPRAAAPPPPPSAPPRSFNAVHLLPRPGLPPSSAGTEDAAVLNRYGLDGKRRRTAGVVGAVSLYDPYLGESLFVMSNAGRCSRVQLEAMARAPTSDDPDATEAAAAAASKVGVAHEQRLRQLAHNRKSLGGGDGEAEERDAWQRYKTQLGNTSVDDRLATCERALDHLATVESAPLRTAMLLAAETQERVATLHRETVPSRRTAPSYRHASP